MNRLLFNFIIVVFILSHPEPGKCIFHYPVARLIAGVLKAFYTLINILFLYIIHNGTNQNNTLIRANASEAL